MLMDNPDFRYWVSDIRDDHRYRIRGAVGDAAYLSVTAYARAAGHPRFGRVAARGVHPRSGHGPAHVGFTSTTRLDGYADWLAGQDLGAGYLAHRQTLQARDRGDGRRWVLKAPPHLAELPAVVAAFPGSVVVTLHRDIVETIASGASLFAVFRSTYSDEVDATDVGRFQADQTERWLRGAGAYRSDPSPKNATFVDLDYRDLVQDPVAAISQVYAAADLDPPADPAGFVAAYHEAHPRREHGTHRYTAADFGLVEGELRERFAFLDA